MSGDSISQAICKSAPHSRHITMPAPHHSFFTGRMPFLLSNQQRQSTEGTHKIINMNLNWLCQCLLVRVCPALHLCTPVTCLEPVSHKDGGWRSPWQRWDALLPSDQPECSESDVGDVRPVSSDVVHLWQVSARRRLVLPLSTKIQLWSTSCFWTPTSLLECHLHEVYGLTSAVRTLTSCSGWQLTWWTWTVRNFTLVIGKWW